METSLKAGLGTGTAVVVSRSSLFERDDSGEGLAGGIDTSLSPWIWEIDEDAFYCMPDLFRLHGLRESSVHRELSEQTPSNAVRGLWPHIFGDEDRGLVAGFLLGLRERGEGGDVEYRVRRGTEIRTLVARAMLASESPRRVIGYTQDVTAIRSAQARVEEAQRALEQHRALLGDIAAGQPLTETLDALCRQVEAELPGTFCSIMLLDREAAELRHPAVPSLPAEYSAAIDGTPVGEGYGACGTAAARRAYTVAEDVRTSPLTAAYVELMDAHGLRAVWSHPLQSADDEVLGVLSVYRLEPHRPDAVELRLVAGLGTIAALAIERESAIQTVVSTASIDRRTGLPNRSRFLEIVNERLQADGASLSILALDVDRFRQIGDSLGHLADDRIAVAIAERLIAAVGDNVVIARLNDDCFALTVAAGSGVTADALASRVLGAFDAPMHVGGGEFYLVPALGIAHSDGETDAYGLVRDATAAMHVARAEGLGGQQVYDHHMRARVIERIASETALRRAIGSNELVVHYQPILNLASGEWDRVEALVRWQDPQRGLVPPSQFIPLAEQTGLVVPLGERVLRTVTEETRDWRAGAELKIAVNVSVMQLASPTFARELLSWLEQAGYPPNALAIEVTESALMRNFDVTYAALNELRTAGVGVDMDDFGTGYSSLARLGELPITTVKIDQHFVRRLGTEVTARSIVRAVADIASAHGLLTVAEGIEDAATLAEVVALGIDHAQGFHLSRPLTAEATGWLLGSPVPARLLGQLRVRGR